MFPVILTLLCFAFLFYGIIKKWNVSAVMLVITLVGFIAMLCAGTPPMSTSASGNAFIDCFEAIVSSWGGTMKGTILNLAFMFGYAHYMEKIKASEMFSMVCARPLVKLNAPYVCCSLTLLIGALIKVSLASMVTVVALFATTIYPILVAAGASKRSAAAAILFASNWMYGPASGSTVTVMKTTGFGEADLTEFFIKHQLPMSAVEVVVSMIVFYFVCKYFDKKDAANNDDERQSIVIKSLKEVGCPVFYAILPLLPIIFCLMFSSIGFDAISITLAGACLLSLVISLILEIIRNRNLTKTFADFKVVWKGMGEFLSSTGVVIASATAFASFISACGGLATIIDKLISVFHAPLLLIAIGAVAAVLMVLAVGTGGGAAAIVGPMLGGILASGSFSANPFPYIHVVIGAIGLALVCSPVAPCTLLASSYADGDTGALLKREFPCLIASVIVSLIFAAIVA